MANKNETVSPFDCLAVTNVQVFPFIQNATTGKMRGLASVVLNDQLQIRGLSIMEGENGLYVGYPSNQMDMECGEVRTCINPITKVLRDHIEACVLEKYKGSIDPHDWVVKFSLSGAVSGTMSVTVSEAFRDDAIATAKVVIENTYGKALAKHMEVVSAEEK